MDKMKNLYYCQTIVLLFFSLAGFAQIKNNPELQKMADDDQKTRLESKIDWPLLRKEDSIRRIKVFELLKEEKVKTGQDYLNSGIIFQHGEDTISSKMAVKSFEKALKLDSTLNRWWYAAAVDRDLMRRNLPQIYGTQFINYKSTNHKWIRYKIDVKKVTDKERKYYRVETLAEQEEKERLMNLSSISSFYASSNSGDKTIELIKREFKKQKKSGYNVNEDVINSFGYELLKKNKNEDALKIFELNTKLYPNSFNTYDSYGECLMKIGQKKKGIKAYKKSYLLNPKNDNARKILNDNK